MKKILFSAIALVAMSMGVASCGSDDEEGFDYENAKANLKGEWVYNDASERSHLIIADGYMMMVRQTENAYDSIFSSWVGINNDQKTITFTKKWGSGQFGNTAYFEQTNKSSLLWGYTENSMVQYKSTGAKYTIKPANNGTYTLEKQ